MKALNIIGIVLAVAVMPVCIFYVEETSSARWAAYDFFDSFSTYYGPSAREITQEAGAICMLFTLFFIFQLISNLVKVKTTTTKVLAIIGVSLVGIGFLFNLGMLADPGGISFDEGGQIWVLMGLLMLAFSIVFLVQSINVKKPAIGSNNQEIIDDII